MRVHRLAEHPTQRSKLLKRGRQIAFVGPGKMRKHALQPEVRIPRDARKEARGRLHRNTESVHSRIHLDVDRRSGAAAASGVPQKRQVAFMVNDRRRVEGQGGLCLLGVMHAAENKERKGYGGIPQLGGLGHPCHRESLAARTREHARHAHRPVAVGIGLDHGNHASVSGEAPCKGVVRDQGAQIDARDESPRKLHRRVYNPSKIGPKSDRGV
jgi:hypothetical protein